MRVNRRRIALTAAAVLAAVLAGPAFTRTAAAALAGRAVGPVDFAVTGPLLTPGPVRAAAPDGVAAFPAAGEGPYLELRANFERPGTLVGPGFPAAAVAVPPAPPVPGAVVPDDAPMPGLDASFEGLNQGANRILHGFGLYPPDTIGAASSDYYVQAVNLGMAVWDLRNLTPFGTPSLIYGPAPISRLWAGQDSVCATLDDGDPVVLFDELAGRWIVTQFALDYPGSGYHECIAVSRTADPTGGWHVYDYLTSPVLMNDYPKLGVWPDGYYLSVNQFDATFGFAYAGVGVAVFERARMLRGRADARMIYIDTGAACRTGLEVECAFWSMLPSDLEGFPPPPGTPNAFVQLEDDAWLFAPDSLRIWEMSVDWAGGTAAFVEAANLPVQPFDSYVCPDGGGWYDRDCIPQPGTAVGLDAISSRLMHRAQYRIVGDRASLVLNHTVDVDQVGPGDGRAGIRWYELRNAGGGWSVYQQGTHGVPDDGLHRWMGSIAMDRDGNIALGYSISGTGLAPNMASAGRLATDPAGTLPQTEALMVGTGTAAGSQTGTAHRWGDYSMMDVGPDGCTFWYTNEYLRGTTPVEWYTRVNSFRYPSCTPGELRATTFPSVGARDGWVRESGEGTGVGAARGARGALRVGDAADRRQYRTVLSFNTGTLPDAAVVVGGMLSVRRRRLVGDPFATLGQLRADVRRPFFGSGAGLQAVDFAAAADMAGAATFSREPVRGRYAALLSSGATPFVNAAGSTQLRLAFTAGNDGDASADTVLLHPGEAARARRPRLTVYYYTP